MSEPRVLSEEEREERIEEWSEELPGRGPFKSSRRAEQVTHADLCDFEATIRAREERIAELEAAANALFEAGCKLGREVAELAEYKAIREDIDISTWDE